MTNPWSNANTQLRSEHDPDDETRAVKMHGENGSGAARIARVNDDGSVDVTITGTPTFTNAPPALGGSASGIGELAFGSITASYGTAVATNGGSSSTYVKLVNNTNTTLHFGTGTASGSAVDFMTMERGEADRVLGDIGSRNVYVKHAGVAPTNGQATASIIP